MKHELYDVSDFVNDPSFQSFVYKKDSEDMKFWIDWIKKHPHKKKETDQSSYILRSLYVEGKQLTDLEYQNQLERLKGSLPLTKGVSQRALNKSSSRLFYKIAASVSILLIISILYLKYGDTNLKLTQIKAQSDYIEKVAAKGQKLIINLNDGSTVTLNAESKLRYPLNFENGKRVVFLTGEAFFSIEHNPRQPFIVHTEDMVTTVLGTSFNISAYEGDKQISVAVATGKVIFKKKSPSNDSDKVILLPNEMGVFNKAEVKLKKADFNEEEIFGWTAGVLYFKDTPLSEVFVLLERWYGVNIEINDASQINMTGVYTGSFKNESLENVLKIIQYKVKYEYKVKQNNVYIN